MSTPTVDDLNESDVFEPDANQSPNGNADGLKFIDADIGEFIRRPKTARAREYEHKTEAALNSIMRLLAQNPNTVPDAATIIAYGDNFATAVGEVAEISPQTRRMMDLILSPESPWLALAIAGLPMAMQLLRNHEAGIQQIKAQRSRLTKGERRAARAEAKASRPKVTLKLFRREIKITVPFKFKLAFVMSQTIAPDRIADNVFNNEQVVKALKKRGIDVAGYV